MLERAVAEAIASQMGWPEDRVPDLTKHVLLVVAQGKTFAEFRWAVGTVESGVSEDEDPGFHVFAYNVAAELKEQRDRWRVALPWDTAQR